MNEERLLELKDYFLAYPDTPYLPNMFNEIVQVLEQLQQENFKLQAKANKNKHILDELENWLDNFHESSGFQVWEIKKKLKELRGRENENSK